MNVEKYISKSALVGEVYPMNHFHISWQNQDKVRRLMGNELLYPPSPKVIERAREVAPLMNYYPEDCMTDTQLLEKLADYVGLPGKADWITVGNGSMETIEMIYRAFLNPGDEIIVSTPDYSPYTRRAKLFDVKVLDVLPYDDEFNYRIEDFSDKITDKTKLIIISRPNNPDGHFISRSIIEELCNNDCIIVIDEAYYEFATDPIEDLVVNHENVVISHTFSKAMGLAGIRLGWIVANPNIIRYINQIRVPENVNLFARNMAITAIDDKQYIVENVARVKKDRKYLFDEMAKIPGLRPIPSESNFVMADALGTGRKASEVYQFFFDNGIIIRVFINARGLPGDRYFRITIGTHEDVELCVKLLKQFFEVS